MAEAIMEYAQPLIDKTDGSIEQMNKALAISTACWNIAILPQEDRESAISSMGEAISMDEAEFEDFRSSVMLPMIRRHEEMFPGLHQREPMRPPHWGSSLSSLPVAANPKEKSSEPGPYDPCPCNSGKKYKFCCRQTTRSSRLY
jgi:hypothetical protein